MAELIFHGATQCVTGSAYIIKTKQSQLLIECGLIQGSREDEKANHSPFRFSTKQIDAVILSHAHLDHSGRIPKLVADGCSAPIFMTHPTLALLKIMLKDAAFIAERDAEWQNKRRSNNGKAKISPLFTIEDVNASLSYCKSINYSQRHHITEDIDIRFLDAGHILGSSIIEIFIKEDGVEKKLVFTGDLGNGCAALLRDPEIVHTADVLLMESTYGDRNHRAMQDTLLELEEIIESASKYKGNILIPAFAVGRTQEIIFRLGELYHQNKLKFQAVYLDSPMAIATTEVYHRHIESFSKEHKAILKKTDTNRLDQFLPVLHYSRTTQDSMMLNNIKSGAIIIAGSGMCNGGRIRHHLKYNLKNKGTHVIIAGFQVAGTPGRALVDGAQFFHMNGEKIPVNAKIHTLGGFSAHADQSQLVDWASNFKHPRPNIYLIHGEMNKKLALKDCLVNDSWNVSIPKLYEHINF